MCPYYPAKEGLARLTIAEVTEWESETRVERKRAIRSVRERGERLLLSGEEQQNDNSLSATQKHRTQTVDTHTCSQTLYTTFVYVLCLCHLALLIYETLQVTSRRCRALQFMSNLVNILSPVRPVSDCFSPFSMFSQSPTPPRVPLVSPISGRWVTERNQVWIRAICIPSDSQPFVVYGRRCESLTSELCATVETR